MEDKPKFEARKRRLHSVDLHTDILYKSTVSIQKKRANKLSIMQKYYTLEESFNGKKNHTMG